MSKTKQLYKALVEKHDFKNGGYEDFFLQNEIWITCKFADCGIMRRHGLWYYANNRTGYATPLEAYENRYKESTSLEKENNLLRQEIQKLKLSVAQETIQDTDLVDVLWSLSLSDHLGDVAEAIKPILTYFGIKTVSLEQLNDELKKRDLRPDYARLDDPEELKKDL